MKVAVVFPKNNPFTRINTRPVVLAALPYIVYCKLDIFVITPYTDSPLETENLTIINKTNSKSKSRYYKGVVIQDVLKRSDYIEVHQDVKLAAYIKDKYPNKKVALVKHGDYIVNRLKEKLFIYRLFLYFKYLRKLDAIYGVSDFVRDRIKNMYLMFKQDIITVYNTYGHILPIIKNPSKRFVVEKEDTIIFVGKPNKNKGFLQFILSLDKVLQHNNNYKAVVISAFFSQKGKYSSIYKKIISRPNIKQYMANGRIVLKSNLDINSVYDEFAKAKIAVVPSRYNEPFGLVALEAVMAGCALVTSGKGGLKEIAGEHAIYVNPPSVNKLSVVLKNIIDNEDKITEISKLSCDYADKKFDPIKLSAKLDEYRKSKNIDSNTSI